MEYASTEILIQTVCPMLVRTNMIAEMDHEFPQITIVTPQTFAKQAVRSIGLISETTGCISHQLQYAIFYKLMPRFLLNFLIYYQSKTLKDRLRSTAETSKKDT
jgi:short-subunit dehydrogenase